jgi:hypothetical protein
MMDFQSLPMNGEAGLRTIAARDFGITGAKKYSKAELVAMLEAIVAERDAKAEAETMAALDEIHNVTAEATEAKPAAKGMCVVCGERKGMSAAARDRHGVGSDFADMCEADYIESGYENEHSDYGHQTGKGDQGGDVEHCWVCFPDLKADFISAVYRPGHVGTSRAGMKLSVPVRAAGQVKAATTKARLDAAGIESSVKGKKGTIRLVIESGDVRITLAWDINGAYLYEESSVIKGGKARKVRNVKAALTALGIAI